MVVFHYCVCLSLVWLRSDGVKLINNLVPKLKKLKLHCSRTKRRTLQGSNPFAMSVLTNLRGEGREILHGFPTSIWTSHVSFTIIRITARFCISGGVFVESCRSYTSLDVWRLVAVRQLPPARGVFSVRTDLCGHRFLAILHAIVCLGGRLFLSHLYIIGIAKNEKRVFKVRDIISGNPVLDDDG